MEPRNDNSLMLLYGAGELKHFETLFRAWNDPVYRYLYHMLKEEAEAVYQATWLKFIERRVEFREDENFKAWLFGIAHSELIENLKSRGLESIMDAKESAAEISSQNLHELHFRSRLEQGLIAAVSTLPAQHKEAFLLSEEGLSIEEIAGATFVSSTVASSRLKHAHEILDKTLSAWGTSMKGNLVVWSSVRDVERDGHLDDQILATSKLPDWPPKLVNLEEEIQDAEAPEDEAPKTLLGRIRPIYAIIGLVLAIAVGVGYVVSFSTGHMNPVQQAKVARPAPSTSGKVAETPKAEIVETAPFVESVPATRVDPFVPSTNRPLKHKATKRPVPEPEVEVDPLVDENELALAAAEAEAGTEPDTPPEPQMVWVRRPDNSYWNESNPIKTAPYFVGGGQ